ncbi:MAG TPA: hypothetical protein VHR66_10575 [Gemmataceae bacterium]|jgi:hypothetical protein|nr:hypothetical protein [Gemmataceae bacterium]
MSRPLSFVALVLLTSIATADAPRFRFTKGETLAYHLVQTTNITDTVVDEKTSKPTVTEVSTKVDLMRQWKVTDVDDKGVATLELSITSMRWERKAGKEEDVFDSSKPDDLNKSEMAKHVGPVLAVLRIDNQGKLVEVKESKVGPAARFAVELPFKMTLPDAEVKVGESWGRTYTIQLDPPLGTGETYPAGQKYTVEEPKSGFLVVGLATTIGKLPTQAADQIPLLPMMQEGTLFFHAPTGRYYGARLKLERELKNHQGEGSSYKYTSNYVEDLAPVK